MNTKRFLCIVLSFPIWLLAGFITACICIPLIIVGYVVAVMEYGFTGRWDSPL